MSSEHEALWFLILQLSNFCQMKEPTEKPSATRPPESSHTPAKSSSEECSQAPKAKRGLEERMPRAPRCRRAKHIRITTAIEDAPGRIISKTAACTDYQQPCLHYNSIINAHPLTDYANNPCPYRKQDYNKELKAKLDYYSQHPKSPGRVDWFSKIPPFPGNRGCEADEWPPAALYHDNDGYKYLKGGEPRVIDKPQFIRLMDGTQNGDAGQLWKGCPNVAAHEDIDTVYSNEVGSDNSRTEYTKVRAVYTRTTMRINFDRLVQPDNDDGLERNVCQPQQQGVDHRGFALLDDDPWFDGKAAAKALTEGYKDTPKFKRRWIDLDQITAVEANSSKHVTDEALKKDFEIIRCVNDGCGKELTDVLLDAAEIYAPSPHVPVQVPVTSSTLAVAPALTDRKVQITPPKGITSAHFPRRTQSTTYM